MRPADGAHRAPDARASAAERVDAAAAERSRVRTQHDTARGSSTELQADVALKAADDELAARVRWLHWIEENDY
jgi:hypothetical protein